MSDDQLEERTQGTGWHDLGGSRVWLGCRDRDRWGSDGSRRGGGGWFTRRLGLGQSFYERPQVGARGLDQPGRDSAAMRAPVTSATRSCNSSASGWSASGWPPGGWTEMAAESVVPVFRSAKYRSACASTSAGSSRPAVS